MKKVVKLNSIFKKISLSILALSLSANIFAFDYGAVISDSTGGKNDIDGKFVFTQKNDLSIWFRTPLGSDVNNYFITEALYRLDISGAEVNNYLDLSLLKFVYFKEFENGQIDASAGRFYTADLTGVAFAQNSDGIFGKYTGSFYNTSLYLGYTGLQNANITKMIAPEKEVAPSKNGVYVLAEKYFVTMATASFPSLFKNQSVSAQWVGAFRTETNSYAKNFINLNIAGPIIKNLLYDVTGSIEFSSYKNESAKVDGFVKAKVGYYFPNASAGANLVFAGKDFVAVTSSSVLNSIAEPEYNKIVKFGLFGTYKPLSSLLISGNLDFAWGDENYEFKAVQYGVNADYQIRNDVLVGLTWNQYFAINQTDVNYNVFAIRAKLSL